MADTITTHIDGSQVHSILGGIKGVIRNTLDFSANNSAATDIVQALKVGAGMIVTNVRTRVITAEGAACTGDVGGYNDAADLNAAENVIETNLEADPFGEGKYYAADDTIDLTLDHVASVAVLEVSAEYIQMTVD